LGKVSERLDRNRYETDNENPHITADQELVASQGLIPLLVRICPAHVYSEQPDGSLGILCAACLECGTCLAVTPEGALSWHYPRGGFGVFFREG
jgi:ferredoxin like protein